MTASEVREMVERHRRAQLHAQIGALEARFQKYCEPRYSIDWLKRLRLSKKIARLRAELDQPMLLPSQPHGRVHRA